MTSESYTDILLREFARLKDLAEEALAQVDDDAFFATLAEGDNSPAVIVKHIAGNLRSRWQDFLTTDGEKPDRRRDTEFVIDANDTRAGLMERWEVGWSLLFENLGALGPGDFERTVRVRGESLSVLQAVNRQLTHGAYHIGQIVLLARHHAGSGWRSLSISRGASEQFNERPPRYVPDP